MPQPQYQVNLTGVWGTYMNGQPVIMQIYGNQYQAWMNGMLFEAGYFQVQGNILQGQTTTGEVFSRYLYVDPSGMVFNLTDPYTGISVTYQRMQ